MDEYLTKPLNRALLESTLRQWMAHAATPTAALATPEPSPTPPGNPLSEAPPAAVATSTAPAIDTDILAELRDVMGQEFVALVHVFLDDAPRAIARLRELAQQQDIAAMSAPAHTLKSTSANLGALVLSGLARGIELDARQGHLVDAQTRTAALQAEFSRVTVELRRHIA